MKLRLSLHGCKEPIRCIFRLRKGVHDDRLDAMTTDGFERVVEDELDSLRCVSLPSELRVYDKSNVEVVHPYGVVARLGRHSEVDHPDNVFSFMVWRISSQQLIQSSRTDRHRTFFRTATLCWGVTPGRLCRTLSVLVRLVMVPGDDGEIADRVDECHKVEHHIGCFVRRQLEFLEEVCEGFVVVIIDSEERLEVREVYDEAFGHEHGSHYTLCVCVCEFETISAGMAAR